MFASAIVTTPGRSGKGAAALIRNLFVVLVAGLGLVAVAGIGFSSAADAAQSGKKKASAAARSSNDSWGNKSYLGAKVSSGRSASSSIAEDRPAKRRTAQRSRNVRVASLGKDVYPTRRAPSRSVASTGGNIIWQASASCLNGTLRSALNSVSGMAKIRVNSTCRSQAHNRAVGGAKHSHHLTGDAVDFRVLSGNSGAVLASLRNNGSVGGIKHYGGGLYHIDTGPRRSW